MTDLVLTEEQALQAELDALRAANEGLHVKARVSDLRRQIDAERLAARKAALEDRFTAELGGPVDVAFRFVVIDSDVVVVKTPHELHYKRFRDSGKTDLVACLQFIKPSVVFPDASEFAALCERKPATADQAAAAGLFLCGVRSKDQEGK